MLSNLKKYDIILASKSPRRKELLSGLGIDFRIFCIDGIEESFPATLHAKDIPEYIAKEKASAYSSILKPETMVITADTVVICNDAILGKPYGYDEAERMLHKLSGKAHQVTTGVAISTLSRSTSFSVTTDVRFAKLSNEEINYYIEHYKPFDKAGAYGIQEWIGFIAVESINGSYFNVMGLPIQRLYQELKKW